jgi:hypothetical protein
VKFRFTQLHCDKKRNVDIGNAHFSLLLYIDKDGDGTLESTAGYGVNLHAEDPTGCVTNDSDNSAPPAGGPPFGTGGPPGRPF